MDLIHNVDRAQLRRDIATVTGWANELARSGASREQVLAYQRFRVDVLDRIAALNEESEAAAIALRARDALATMQREENDVG